MPHRKNVVIESDGQTTAFEFFEKVVNRGYRIALYLVQISTNVAFTAKIRQD